MSVRLNDRELDRVLGAWIEEGPTVVADWVTDGAMARIATVRQRPTRLRPLRELTRLLRAQAPAFAVTLILVALLAGYVLLPGLLRPPPAPHPSPAVIASPSVSIPDRRDVNAGSIDLGGQATTLRTTETALWAAVGDRIVRIDPLTGEVHVAVEVPDLDTSCAECRPSGAWSFDVDADSAWVTYHRETQSIVRRFDLQSGSLLAEITLGTAEGGGSGADDVTVAFGSVWVVMCHSLTVARIDPATDEETTLIRLGLPAGGPCPQMATIGASPDAIWAGVAEPPGAGEGVVVHIDPVSNQVVATIRTTSLPCGRFASDAISVWISTCPGPRNGTLLKIDSAESVESDAISLDGLAGDPILNGGTLWLPVVDADHSFGSGEGSLLGFDAETSLMIDAIRLGSDVPAHPKTAAAAVIAFDALWVTGDGGILLRIPLAELGG